MGNPEKGLRKVFPENADMPDSVEVAAAEAVAGSPHNRVVADIRRVAAVAVDNQRLQGHLRQPRCRVGRLPHRTLGSHSIAFCTWAGICSKAADEREDENTSADNTDPDTAAAYRSTAGNMPYKSLHPYCLYLQKSSKWPLGHPNPRNFVAVWVSVLEADL